MAAAFSSVILKQDHHRREKMTVEEDIKKEGADGGEVAFAVAEPLTSGFTGVAFKESKDQTVGIAFRQELPDHPVTISKNTGLFANTDLKVGMEVESINGTVVDGLTRLKAISFIKEAEGKVTVVGKAVKGGAIAVVFKESIGQKCGIAFKQDVPTDPVTISRIGEDGLFVKTDLKVGMQVMSVNNVPVEGLDKTQAIQFLKDAEGKVVVVGAPPTNKPKPAAAAATATATGTPPPPGVAAGGQWGTNKYIGQQTQMLMCFGCLCFGLPGLCVCFCPQDDRDAYRLGNQIYDASGKPIGTYPGENFVPTRNQMQRT
eukprot:CAMPEP_0113622500 /NCGR_PEP_ID=MMETSP0017_2-20120614/11532_1 /TAXON_ID=2856 /ORGANISM="Cylindrotheca closterium" /LENGTH=315 /DNA_ID=CAMNT_0000532337 /DNA_START=27 /DNA_END=974 /DNA_ORIENTATION=- /assembly_acc=CAM_ASM_000147